VRILWQDWLQKREGVLESRASVQTERGKRTMTESCWWISCTPVVRPAGKGECEGCEGLVIYDEPPEDEDGVEDGQVGAV